MAPRAEKQIVLEISPEAALRVAEKILAQIGADLTSRTSSTLVARKGMSFKSWGEEIRISVRSSGAEGTAIRIRSESLLMTTFMDWGANSDNVERIVQAFRAARTMSQQATESR